ncbi:MAG: threonine ammonia-lyase [Clostridia bacterium]|nr:threonine ammonia-lyase [Clostridia bacterium]
MITFEDVVKAREVLRNVTYRTELMQSRTFNKISGNLIYLKTENFQKTGSFKLRGAYNKIANLTTEEKEKGVVTASAGNHAQGVAYAASSQKIRSVVVMPETTPIAKITATKGYGAEVVLFGGGYDDAFRKAMEIRKDTGMTFVHAFDDPYVIAGQGTIAIEMLEEIPELDMIVAPVGGGGMISGIALAAKSIKPDIKVIGVEAEGFDAMRKSVSEGEIVAVNAANTIADGIAVRRPGDLTFSLIQKYVDEIVTVTEDEIASTILMLLERSKIMVEGAGAASLAAVIDKKILARDKKIGIVISGGNIDINLVSMIIDKGLIKSGRKVEIRTVLRDKPGQLRDLLDLLASAKVNIISVNHNREKEGINLGFAEVDMVLETQGREHAEKLIRMLNEKGYVVKMEN